MTRKKLLVHRKGHHRDPYVRKDGTPVKGTWIPPTVFEIIDRGKPGKGPKIITLEKGEMFPYNSTMNKTERRNILKTLINRDGATTIFRRLNALVVLNKRNTDSRAYKVFKADRDWVKQRYDLGQ